ncbi:MAG: M56 and MltD domain-containing protein [Oligoflexia bacterium]|nr:M56 and MltD domain-containing protein [Oligoflexia bacterium]
MLHPLIPKKAIFEPTAKVWSAQSLKTFSRDFTAPDQGGYLSFPTGNGAAALRADQVSLALFVLGLLVTGYGAFRIGQDLSSLRRIRRQSFLIKRFGRVFILANDQITVPFSYWTPRRAAVVVPVSLLAKRSDYRMAIAHELQHHRQADTRWVYGLWALRVFCILNPFAHFWNRWLPELQEFACDETLVDQCKVESRQYARCLIEVAETALNQEYAPACATGLVFLVERNLLKRRVEKMVGSSKTQVTRSISWSVGGLIVALMTATAFASQSIVQDRRVSLTDAREMALRARSETGFPVVVNELVLKELNRYVGTPEGRDFMRKSLQRLEGYRTLVEGKIRQYQVPLELMAIPIIESGYQNLEQGEQPGWGAGLWMFIESTARNYGLRVDEQVDERLNAELLTDAAMRYLKANALRFDDWLLSVLAYNVGETRVQKAIDKTGSRDAWALVRAGYENDKSYLPRVMAAVLIMKNPDAVAP